MQGKSWLAISLSVAVVTTVAACNRSTTAPVSNRTKTVTAVASVPAVPTAPVTVATSDPQSNTSATFDVATLNQIVSLVGGAAKVTMADVPPADFASTAEAATVNQVSGTQLGVIEFNFTSASSGLVIDDSLVGAGSNGGTKLKDQTATYPVPIRFYYTPPTPALAIPAGTVDVYMISGGVASSSKLIGTLTITADNPQLISGTLNMPFTSTRITIVFIARKGTGGA